MNWVMLGAIGQLAGVLIGIPSIIYLAIQTRTQTEERRFAHLDGVLGESAWGKVERTMSDLVACPGVRQWWEVRRQLAHTRSRHDH